jgi:hypothetical protein
MDKPAILYKYRPCDRFNEDVLLAHEVFLPRPSAFNDPFDCRISLRYEGGPQEWVRFFSDSFRRDHPDWPESRISTEVASLLDGGMPQAAQTPHFAQWLIDQDLQRMEVLSLSESRDNILLWAHYADRHRGVCFGFATQEWVLLKHAQPVKYQADYPTANALQISMEDARERVGFTKAIAWAYEREWRVVRSATPNQRYRFPPEALVEVILGAEIDPADERRVLVMGYRSHSRPRYLRAVPDPASYGLNLVDVPITPEIVAEALGEGAGGD